VAEENGNSLMKVGRITGCYGVKGWVRVHPYTEDPLDFLEFPQWFLRRRNGEQEVEFDEGRRHGKGLIAHLQGVDDRTAAEALCGSDIWAEQQALPELEAGDYYWHELEGLKVWCRHGGQRLLLGRVDRLLETGANDVLVVRPCEGSIDQRERLIPYLPDSVVLGVDTGAGTLDVAWHPED
jgi:16S rRNA processing protein RimM